MRGAAMKDFSGVWFTKSNMPFVRALYDTLLDLDKDFKPQPRLATSWQFSPDGLSPSVKVCQGVKFHSGRAITSENVKYSREVGVDEKSGLGSQLRQTSASR
ncbi:MAG: ABC transporter substrate-binding protein [Chloroflexota bacterium]